ncbi:pyridoxal-phosphate dependent enzyme [Rhizobium jaguaris]|uniref:pyridoxal-phosphate dependent enzyme n=1 Tax=Rhizobium jaguaris TaxID=1312183 RepID=UPI001FE13F8E|nr:pyridoxal-phosphate dependent enzyme [Rhizobium jaguaris]
MQEGTSRSNQAFYLARNGLQNISIIAAETEGAASLAVSVKAGKITELPAITSIATSLGARKVRQRAFEITQTLPVDCVVVDDQAAVNACMRFLDDHCVVVEPACGAAWPSHMHMPIDWRVMSES